MKIRGLFTVVQWISVSKIQLFQYESMESAILQEGERFSFGDKTMDLFVHKILLMWLHLKAACFLCGEGSPISQCDKIRQIQDNCTAAQQKLLA